MLEIPFLQLFIKDAVKRQAAADTVDNLNYFVTSCLLGFFALITSAKQYFGTPIQCWTPNEFNGAWQEFAEDYCFISPSYVLPDEVAYPSMQDAESVRHTDHVSYYRWVPIMLAIQCVFFYLPNFFWNSVQKKTAINPETFLKEAEKLNSLVGEEREKELTRLADYYLETVSLFGSTSSKGRMRMNPRSGRNATRLYLLTKMLYLANIYGQICLLSTFLGEDYMAWGYESFWNIVKGFEWRESSIFPRLIMCDFKIRKLGNVNNFSVQCVLMMNMINEKLYLLIFFWFIFLCVVTVANFIYYLLILLVPRFRKDLVLVQIDEWRRGVSTKNQQDILTRFVDECLHPDGVLLLQFLSDHCGGRIVYDLTNKMLAKYNTSNPYKSYSETSSITKGSFLQEEHECNYVLSANDILPFTRADNNANSPTST